MKDTPTTNDRLIAAAPEMLKALEAIDAEVSMLQESRRLYRVDSRMVGTRLRYLDETIQIVRAAIAKATL